MALYIKINGINGSVSASGYENWIIVHSLQHHLSQAVSNTTEGVHNRSRDSMKFSEVIITKGMDNASIMLLTKAYNGYVFPMVECNVVATGDQLTTLASYKFHQVMISRYATTLGSHGLPIETLTLNFTKIETTIFSRDEKNETCSPSTAGFDLVTMSAI
jgi:type VI secretion system secreted protein Hcp